jgi:hypothetical protein
MGDFRQKTILNSSVLLEVFQALAGAEVAE